MIMIEKEWFDHQARVVREQISQCNVFTSIVTEHYLKSPECMLQLGAAIRRGGGACPWRDPDRGVWSELVEMPDLQI